MNKNTFRNEQTTIFHHLIIYYDIHGFGTYFGPNNTLLPHFIFQRIYQFLIFFKSVYLNSTAQEENYHTITQYHTRTNVAAAQFCQYLKTLQKDFIPHYFVVKNIKPNVKK